jgi:flagellar FliL protein
MAQPLLFFHARSPATPEARVMPEEKSEAPAAPKKSKKGLLIAIVAVVLLGGGGAGAYFAFAGGDKKAEAAKAEKAKAAVKLPAQFVEMDPFVVNFEPGSTSRFLQITVQLMTREPEMVEFLDHNKPIIRNNLLLLFGNKHVEEVASHEGKEALRMAALEDVRKIIKEEGGKPEGLEAIYFTSFVMQ